MTLPNQPDSATEVRRLQDFYRIKRELLSAGDIFEVDVGTRAIYVGPDSDVSEIKVLYFNQQQQPENIESAIVSPNGPWMNRVDAALGTKAPLTNLPGRILVTPADFIDPNYVRPVSNPALAPLRTFLVRPAIDLICAFNEIDVPDVRADKTHRFPSVPFERDGAEESGATDVIIPVYGRRLISVFLIVPTGTGNFNVSFLEVILQPGAASTPGYGLPRLLATEAIAGASVAQTFPFVFRASSDVRAIVDTANGTDQELDPVPGPIGMMDYFIISLQKDLAEDPAGQLFCQLYVRLSDREV